MSHPDITALPVPRPAPLPDCSHLPALIAAAGPAAGFADRLESGRLSEVELYSGRLRENGIWTPDGKVAVDFDDPQSAEAIVNLVYIIGCAKGIFIRVPAPDDQGSDDQAMAAEAPASQVAVTSPLRAPRIGWTEERRRRHSDQMKAYWRRRRAEPSAPKAGWTEEARRQQSERLKAYWQRKRGDTPPAQPSTEE